MSTRAAPRALQHLGKGHRATIAPLVLAGLLLVGLLGYWLDFQTHVEAAEKKHLAFEHKAELTIKTLNRHVQKSQEEKWELEKEKTSSESRNNKLNQKVKELSEKSSQLQKRLTATGDHVKELIEEQQNKQKELLNLRQENTAQAEHLLAQKLALKMTIGRSKKAEDRLNAAQDVLLRLFSGRARVKTLKDDNIIQETGSALINATNNVTSKEYALDSRMAQLMHLESPSSDDRDLERISAKPCATIATISNFDSISKMSSEATINWIFQDDLEGGAGYNHMAMISSLPGSSPWSWILIWQSAAFREGTYDQKFRYVLSLDMESWSNPLELSMSTTYNDTTHPIWSPTLLHQHDDSADILWLFYAESVSCERPQGLDPRKHPQRWSPGGSIRYILTTDGLRWSTPVTIHAQHVNGGVPKVIANQPIILSSAHQERAGWWVLPVWREVPRGVNGSCSWQGRESAGVLVSKDSGRTWEIAGDMRSPSTWLIEGTLIERRDGSILQYFRTGRNVHEVFSAESFDGGLTWEQARSTSEDTFVHVAPGEITTLPNPNRVLAIAYNHEGESGLRIHLRVALSPDDGTNWYHLAEIEKGDADAPYSRYHYPTLMQDGCRLYVVYSVLHTPPEGVFTGPGGVKIAQINLSKVAMLGSRVTVETTTTPHQQDGEEFVNEAPREPFVDEAVPNEEEDE